ncbi:unnamed protein product (macronuclear) [Paramecium tetraurelia]|uniref:Uncharacterized protein n=1 Tax=Paramecium tetraurelia TaxID=5888 RepID=A0C0A3_PARTE|nr:uncharacterized protein GSPATT00006073001 [Paramecium tetraurelia]CAK64220.1 unnamed protein product [Paramecium tetraurelia]|eukprot:XP_001431618.1 hypothetical protein (macronuclear) [Paramecium tetraurelia strain d4-2]
MRQQKDGLFCQSQLYVKELCESLNVLEFLDDQANLSISQSFQPENQQLSNKGNKNENLTKSRPQAEIKQNPYGSEWANKVLETQFGVHLSQITQRKRPKWIIKKLKPVENDDNNEKQHSRLINVLKTFILRIKKVKKGYIEKQLQNQITEKQIAQLKIIDNLLVGLDSLYLLLEQISFKNWINKNMIIFYEFVKNLQSQFVSINFSYCNCYFNDKQMQSIFIIDKYIFFRL